jgi:hypothetical protein
LPISSTSLPRSRCAAGIASPTTNRRSWSGFNFVIVATGKPAGNGRRCRR